MPAQSGPHADLTCGLFTQAQGVDYRGVSCSMHSCVVLKLRRTQAARVNEEVFSLH